MTTELEPDCIEAAALKVADADKALADARDLLLKVGMAEQAGELAAARRVIRWTPEQLFREARRRRPRPDSPATLRAVADASTALPWVSATSSHHSPAG